jgi:hypothetical protein
MIGGSRRAEARLDFGPLGHARQQAFVQLLPLQLHRRPAEAPRGCFHITEDNWINNADHCDVSLFICRRQSALLRLRVAVYLTSSAGGKMGRRSCRENRVSTLVMAADDKFYALLPC